jgi:hypothetical protein
MGTKLFISYAHEDEAYRVDFEKHLASLKREGLINEWTDRMITAGSEWAREIEEHLDQSNIILLFISPDFMASRYCAEVEVQRAMQRHRMGISKVIPVLIRPADWHGAPFAKLQAIPGDSKAISEWENRDAAFLEVTNQLRVACKEIASVPGNPANPYTVANIGDWSEAEVEYKIFRTGQTLSASLYMELTEKNAEFATVKTVLNFGNRESEEKVVKIPLGAPLEDSMGAIVNAITSQHIPANTIIEVHQNSGGAEKLFIGENVYYTTWVIVECEVKMGQERLVQQTKKWMSEKIPLDGIVKSENTIQGLYSYAMTVIGYRNGEMQSGIKPTGKDKQIDTTQIIMPGLYQIITGNWKASIIESNGFTIPATFNFDSEGGFDGVINSEVVGLINVQGRWRVQNQNLFLEGSQAYSIYNIPYATAITFLQLTDNILEGQSQTGEQVLFERDQHK